MQCTRGVVLFTLALLLTGGLLLVRNKQLRTQLELANEEIQSLRAGSLHQGATLTQTDSFDFSVLNAGVQRPQQMYQMHKDVAASATSCNTCSLQTEHASSTPPMLSRSGATALLDLKRIYAVGPATAKFTLFIFFSPTDCPACLTEAGAWQELYDQEDSLKLDVIGIIDRVDEQEAQTTLKKLGIGFPTIFDPHSALRTTYGILTTPTKVLVDQNGRVLLTSSGDPTSSSQAQFERAIKAKCQL